MEPRKIYHIAIFDDGLEHSDWYVLLNPEELAQVKAKLDSLRMTRVRSYYINDFEANTFEQFMTSDV